MKRKGPWSQARIERHLDETRAPLRLACNGATGHPVLVSLWFVWLDGRLWCATQQTAHVVSHLGRDPRCAFEASVDSPPYFGVRGQGVATLDESRGEEILRRLIERYLDDSNSRLAGMLLARVETEVAIAIEPQMLVSWDYRKRMGDAA